MKQPLFGLLVACALAAGACGQSTDTSTPATPSGPDPSTLVTENFSGTVNQGGNDAHTFTVTANNANLTAALTSVGPPATIAEGFGIGQTVAGSCQLLSGGYGTYTAGTTPQLAGTIPTGTYCVMVFDVGNQTAAVTYTVVVTHY